MKSKPTCSGPGNLPSPLLNSRDLPVESALSVSLVALER